MQFFGNLSSSQFILLVGGSGDTKDSFEKLIPILSQQLPQYKIITFSFKGVEEQRDLPLKDQIDDLKNVLEFITGNTQNTGVLIATSNGAFSTTHIVLNPRYKTIIKQVLFIDPADYYTDTEEFVSQAHTWTGVQQYAPSRSTISSLLHKITYPVKIHVINFTIRNYGRMGYVPISERGIDSPQFFSRLNNKMVQSFFLNTPMKNKGRYLEVATIPHAFMRDGDILKNCQMLVMLINTCLSEASSI